VFGTMLGTEVNILDGSPEDTAGVGVAVPISLADQRTDLLVAAWMSEAVGLELAARMLQSPPGDLPADAVSSALSEIVNMVGARVQQALNNAGLRADIGVPAPAPHREPAPAVTTMALPSAPPAAPL